MAMIVRTNINSMNANRNLSINNSQVATSLEKLASGYAINRAADDASGLAVSEKMRAQITGLDQGTENALDGVCLIQTAEGAMDEIHNMLNRMVELSTKSANGTIQDEVDREAIQAEIDVLISEIDRIAQSTNYNGIPLLDGNLAGCNESGSTDGSGVTIPTFSNAKSPSSITQPSDYTINYGDEIGISPAGGGFAVLNDTVTTSAVKISFDDHVPSDNTGVWFTYTSGEFSAPDAVVDMTSIESATTSLESILSDGGLNDVIVYNNGSEIFIQFIDGSGSSDTSELYGSKITSAVSLNGTQWKTTETDVTYEPVAAAIYNFTDQRYAISIDGTYYCCVPNDGGISSDVPNAILINVDSSLSDDERIDIFFDIIRNEYNESAFFTKSVSTMYMMCFAAIDEYSSTSSFSYESYTTNDTENDADADEYSGLILHVADENNPYNKIQIYVDSMRSVDLGIDPLDVSTQDSAGACIDVIKNAINYVSTNRANVGALQNRLERTVNNNNNTSENMSSALSTIKDTDMAAEMMQYTTMNVLVQSAQSMLAQSNQAPQSILELLG